MFPPCLETPCGVSGGNVQIVQRRAICCIGRMSLGGVVKLDKVWPIITFLNLTECIGVLQEY
jgi:hypothetical protein